MFAGGVGRIEMGVGGWFIAQRVMAIEKLQAHEEAAMAPGY